MTVSKDENRASMTGDSDPLSPAIKRSLRRLYSDVDTGINEVDTRVRLRLERRLVEEGLLADTGRPDEKNPNFLVRFWRNLGGWHLSFNAPILAIASLVIVSFGVILYQQQQKTLQIESELKAAKVLLERQESDSTVYAKSEAVTNEKLYTDDGDALIIKVRNLARPLGMKVEVVTGVASEGAAGNVPLLRDGQRLIKIGPFISKDPRQKELRALLDLPDDIEGGVNLILVEF